jgi:hypothetical protein
MFLLLKGSASKMTQDEEEESSLESVFSKMFHGHEKLLNTFLQ